ncbi:MAG: hypothetical protein WC647_03945 [Desulfomonilaceae bacterium]|jgi:hypothetical protein
MTEKFVTHEELDRFRQEVNACMAEMLKLVTEKTATDYGIDEPEIAPRKVKSKALQGAKFDLRVRVDKNLADMLFEHAKRDYGGNISRTLDVVLWRFYGRPQLSWEGKQNEE